MRNNFLDSLRDNPIIAAVKNINKVEAAVKSPCNILFLLTGNIFNLKDIVDKAKSAGMLVCIHLDLIEGLSKDAIALQYISQNIKPYGIITTKPSLVKQAKDMGIFTIQRFFILDSLSLASAVKSIHATKPDAIEILPGIMPKVAKSIYKETNLPLILGGLIVDKEDVIHGLEAGALGISSSREEVWYF